MKRSGLIIGILLFCLWSYAQDTTPTDSVLKDKYTFGDFFDAIELPAMFGVGFSPYGIEKAALTTTVRVGWRYHKVYGVFAGIVYENHIHAYEDLHILETNIRSGDVMYHDVGFFVGYRIPLVKHLQQFYQCPYHVPCNVYLSVQPSLTISDLMHVVAVEGESDRYDTPHQTAGLVPSVKFSLGFEWFIVPRFSVAVETGYLQHCKPTAVEQAAIEAGRIKTAAGIMNVGIALSVLFK